MGRINARKRALHQERDTAKNYNTHASGFFEQVASRHVFQSQLFDFGVCGLLVFAQRHTMVALEKVQAKKDMVVKGERPEGARGEKKSKS